MSFERVNFNSSESAEDTPENIRLENAGKMIDEYLGLKPDEKVLFIIDDQLKNSDPALISALQQQLTARGQTYEILVADGKTTQKDLLDAVDRCDLVWDAWDMIESDDSVDFYQLTEHLAQTGKRMAWCPEVSAQSLDNEGALTESRSALEFRLDKMETKLRNTLGLRVKTWYDTDLKIPLERGKRHWYKDSGAIEVDKWDSLPGDEIFITPDEEKVEGILVLPVLQDEIAPDQGVDEFVRSEIKYAKIRRIDGGASAEKLRQHLLEKAPQKDDPQSVLNCAEIAFGANSKARTVPRSPSGSWLEVGNPTTETEKRFRNDAYCLR